MPLNEAVLDYQVIGQTTTPDRAGSMRVIVVAAREPMIMRLVDAVRGAGLRPEGIDLSAFALMRIVAPGNDPEPAPARVFCHLAGVTNLAVDEGYRVKKGQFLMQIDPRLLASAAQQAQAGLEAAGSQMEQLARPPDGYRELNEKASRSELRRASAAT